MQYYQNKTQKLKALERMRSTAVKLFMSGVISNGDYEKIYALGKRAADRVHKEHSKKKGF